MPGTREGDAGGTIHDGKKRIFAIVHQATRRKRRQPGKQLRGSTPDGINPGPARETAHARSTRKAVNYIKFKLFHNTNTVLDDGTRETGQSYPD